MAQEDKEKFDPDKKLREIFPDDHDDKGNWIKPPPSPPPKNEGSWQYGAMIGAPLGLLSRLKENTPAEKFTKYLISQGVPPALAASQASAHTLPGGTGSGGTGNLISLATDIRTKDPTASGAVNYGTKMAGQTLPNVVAATIEDMTTGKNPRGLGAGDVAAKDASARQRIRDIGEGGVRLYNLPNGEQILLRPEQAEALTKDLEAKNKPSIPQKSLNVVKSANTRFGDFTGDTNKKGKLFGMVGGASAGYQAGDAYDTLKNAKTKAEFTSGLFDLASALGYGAAALPIKSLQLPGLALGASIPLAQKFFGSPAKAADYPSAYPEKESDNVGEALTAGQLAAGLAAVYPPAAPVAIPVGLGLGAIDFARRGGKKEAILNAEKIRKFESLGDPTEEEIQEAINSGAYRQMGRR
jgi:hypothetical protein